MAQQPDQAKPDTQPEDDAGKVGEHPHGIPPEVLEAEPTGLPTSDRHEGEVTPAKP